jgi:hypothetical protein
MRIRTIVCAVLSIAFSFTAGTSNARWMNPNTGRFQTMDSYEGNQEDPLSLHKYLYCRANPVNRRDPSGHLDDIDITAVAGIQGTWASSGATVTSVAQSFAVGRIESALAQSAINGLVTAGAGVLVGGVTYGVISHQTSQEFETIQTQTAQRANPTRSHFAYQNFQCDSFAADAKRFFQNEGDNPQVIRFQAYPVKIKQDAIWAAVGPFAGIVISESGYHEGVLVDGNVYDNNLPFGVSRRMWEKYSYLVDPIDKPLGSFISFRKAFNQNYGTIMVSP